MAKPTLVINPATDALFASFATMLVDHGAVTATELERRLRSEYPAAAVHARLLSGEPKPVWYVYREGRWVAGPGDGRDHQHRSEHGQTGRSALHGGIDSPGRGDSRGA